MSFLKTDFNQSLPFEALGVPARPYSNKHLEVFKHKRHLARDTISYIRRIGSWLIEGAKKKKTCNSKERKNREEKWRVIEIEGRDTFLIIALLSASNWIQFRFLAAHAYCIPMCAFIIPYLAECQT